MFVRRRHGRCLILLLYVDDNILTGNDSSLLFDFIKGRRSWVCLFHPLHYFLGMEVSRSTSGLRLTQTKYTLEFLSRPSCPALRLYLQVPSYPPAPTPIKKKKAGCPDDRRSTSGFCPLPFFYGHSKLKWPFFLRDQHSMFFRSFCTHFVLFLLLKHILLCSISLFFQTAVQISFQLLPKENRQIN